ncbi:hypothetical protein OG762_39185 [Streptomyces sp. NBC_01136]|uniref:hypothetical protein n=1 Tax=Streptomyces sp. NBC_01136 TaxID=2903754 RepID=UPI00386C0ACC|nr:hypothetical protein OG762_39185 [Streptomyces sp. NBC_01136]
MTVLVFVLCAAVVLCAVESQEARTVLAAAASVRRADAAIAAAGTAALLVAAAVGLAVAGSPGSWAETVGGGIVLAAGLQWLMWAVRRETGEVPLRDEAAVFRRTSAALASAGAVRGPAARALARAGCEALVVACGLGLAMERPAWWPASALAAVLVATAPALAGRGPRAVLPERAAKAAVAVLLTAVGAYAVTDAAADPRVVVAVLAGTLVVVPRSVNASAPAPTGERRAPARAALDFVVGRDAAVWWAVALLLAVPHLPWEPVRRGPAGTLLTAAVLSATTLTAAVRHRQGNSRDRAAATPENTAEGVRP